MVMSGPLFTPCSHVCGAAFFDFVHASSAHLDESPDTLEALVSQHSDAPLDTYRDLLCGWLVALAWRDVGVVELEGGDLGLVDTEIKWIGKAWRRREKEEKLWAAYRRLTKKQCDF